MSEFDIYTLTDVKNLPDDTEYRTLKNTAMDFLAANPDGDSCPEYCAEELQIPKDYDINILPVNTKEQVIGLIGIKYPERFMAFHHRNNQAEILGESQKINDAVYSKESTDAVSARQTLNNELTKEKLLDRKAKVQDTAKEDHKEAENMRMIYQNRWNDMLRRQHLIGLMAPGIVISSSRITQAGVGLNAARKEAKEANRARHKENAVKERNDLVRKLRGVVSYRDSTRIKKAEAKMEGKEVDKKGEIKKDEKKLKHSWVEYLTAKKDKESNQGHSYKAG